LSAEVIPSATTPSTKKAVEQEEETTFAITTDERRYLFKADSAASAKEWTRAIQKVIFRTHNEGGSVKICLPIGNVIEIEECRMLDLAETVKVRVIDNDETFAIDEVCFDPDYTVWGLWDANGNSTSSPFSIRDKMRSMFYES
jgi:sterol 3beta-glucosyltransferase